MPSQALSKDLAHRCETLLEDIRSESPGAWERLLDAFGPLVLSLARGAGLGKADAEDAFQTTWLALHRSIPRIREPAALAAWIGSTARREAWRVARRRSITSDLSDLQPGSDEQTDHTDPLLALQQLERSQAVQEGLAAIDARCRDLLQRLFFAPESPRYEDIASAMGMKIGSVGPTRIRCLGKLAAWFDENASL